jgi:hypothetical protein
MNWTELETLWRSPHNQPANPEWDRQRRNVLQAYLRRDRGVQIGLALALFWLSLVTGRLVLFLLWPDPTHDRIDWSREWAVVPFLLLPWFGAVGIAFRYWRRRRENPDYERSLVASLRALLEQSRDAARRTRLILGMHLVGVPLLALCLVQLQDVGKATGNQLPSMIVFMAAVVILSVGGISLGWRSQRREIRRLEGLLRDYEETSEGR